MEFKFKIGDRVRVIRNRAGTGSAIGKTGTIVSMTAHPSPLWAVQFDGEHRAEKTGILMNGNELEKWGG